MSVHIRQTPVVTEMADRPYGRRDRIITDPDGCGVRFAGRPGAG